MYSIYLFLKNIRNLKSSMDRFIAGQEYDDVPPMVDLKSSMDRFIVNWQGAYDVCSCLFKIQYG